MLFPVLKPARRARKTNSSVFRADNIAFGPTFSMDSAAAATNEIMPPPPLACNEGMGTRTDLAVWLSDKLCPIVNFKLPHRIC